MEEKNGKMALTRDFRETVRARAKREPTFCKGLLTESSEALRSGEHELSKELLRDYIKAKPRPKRPKRRAR
jgi:hypothetical protein